MRQNRRHPHDTYSTDSYSGDKHRNPCISDTAECTGKDFDGNVGKEGRNQEMDQSVTDFTHRRICGKQRNQCITDKPHKHNHINTTTEMTTEYTIKGMNCTHCQASVTKAIEGVQGVEKVEVILHPGKAIVEGQFDDKAVADADAVRGAGFDIEV